MSAQPRRANQRGSSVSITIISREYTPGIVSPVNAHAIFGDARRSSRAALHQYRTVAI